VLAAGAPCQAAGREATARWRRYWSCPRPPPHPAAARPVGGADRRQLPARPRRCRRMAPGGWRRWPEPPAPASSRYRLHLGLLSA